MAINVSNDQLFKEVEEKEGKRKYVESGSHPSRNFPQGEGEGGRNLLNPLSVRDFSKENKKQKKMWTNPVSNTFSESATSSKKDSKVRI